MAPSSLLEVMKYYLLEILVQKENKYESIFVVLAVLTFLSPQADGNLMHYETWIIMKLTGFRLKVQTKYKSELIEICGLELIYS